MTSSSPTTQESRAEARTEHADAGYRARPLATVVTATLFSVMNSSMVNVALPGLMHDFHIGISTSVWLYTGYTLPYAVAMPLYGVWGERIGSKTVFLIGVVAFLVASLLCSIAWNFASLLVFRVLQALGAAAVIPNAMVLITAAFPVDRRGQALGIWSAVSGIGIGIGLSISPLTSTAMNAAKRNERGRASGFFNTLRFVGAVLGSTILSVILSDRTQASLRTVRAANLHLAQLLASMQAFHDVYLVAAGFSIAATFTALFLRRGHTS